MSDIVLSDKEQMALVALYLSEAPLDIQQLAGLLDVAMKEAECILNRLVELGMVNKELIAGFSGN